MTGASLSLSAEYLAAVDRESAAARQADPSPSAAALPAFRRLSEVDADARISWRIDELLIAGELGLLAGDDGTMKTTLAIAIALAVAGGYPLFGRFQAAPAPVLFISGEDPEQILRNRADALCRGHGWDPERALGNIHVLALAGVDMRSPSWQEHILRAVDQHRPGLVIFDPLSDLATGDENSNSERSAIIRAFRRICAASGAVVLIVHHFKKATADVRKRDLIRGANALTSASRMTYIVEQGPDESLAIECVKFSRAAKRPPFVVRHFITKHETNEALWTSARLEYVTVREATLDAAESFVLETLADGVRRSTTELKNAAKGNGKKISGEDIARALKTLEMRKSIDYQPGEKNAKLWGVCLPEDLRQARQAEIVVAGQAERLPGNHSAAPVCLPAPLGASRQAGVKVAGQAAAIAPNGSATSRVGSDQPDLDSSLLADFEAEMDERRGMQMP